jgi:hypothetical protein
LDGVREIVYSRSLPLATGDLQMQMSVLGDRAGVIGGAHLVLEHVFAPAAVDLSLETASAAHDEHQLSEGPST